MKKKIVLFITMLLVLSMTITSYAAKQDSAGNKVSYNSEDSIKSQKDYYWFGYEKKSESINVGCDAIMAGKGISLSNGNVDGSIRAAAQDINIDGVKTKNNMTMAAQKIKITDSEMNGGYFTCQDLIFDSDSKYLGVTAQNVKISGCIDGDVSIEAENVTINSDAIIKGTIKGKVNKIKIEDGAKVENNDVAMKEKSKQASSNGGFDYKGYIISFATVILIWLLICILMKKKIEESAEILKNKPIGVLITGIVSLIVVPIASIILLVTIVGIPVSLILIMILAIICIVSTAYVGSTLGKMIFKDMNIWLCTLIGTVILWILSQIPKVGIVVTLGAIIFALGSIIRGFYGNMKE